MANSNQEQSAAGFRRLVNAFGYSYVGFRHAMKNEAAVRQELFALVVLIPLSAAVPVTNLEHLVLVLSMLQVVLVELLNSSIESAVDRISLERHPLSGLAKDLASAAVGVALFMSALCWLVIAGPAALHWLGVGLSSFG